MGAVKELKPLGQVLPPGAIKDYRIDYDPDLHSQERIIHAAIDRSHSFERLAKQLHIMDDEKAGVRRTAYGGVVTLHKEGARIFVAPRVSQNDEFCGSKTRNFALKTRNFVSKMMNFAGVQGDRRPVTCFMTTLVSRLFNLNF